MDNLPLLQINGLCKAYPGVIANQDVDLCLMPGTIHALLGENGAGKSTLIKMIYGLITPDSGQMMLSGVPFRPASPRAARQAGVGMVFQHFSLFDALSVAENIALGMQSPPRMGQLAAQIHQVSEKYGLPLAPDRRVSDLSAGERQRVEIIRCLLGSPQLLVMDEPTSVLTPQEVEILFGTLRRLRDEGTAILYISHKLEEIRKLCTSATILRQGTVVGQCDPASSSIREIAEMMVGTRVLAPARAGHAAGERVLLRVNNLTTRPHTPFGVPLRGVGFQLREGEVLGIGGVAGNGQDELFRALSGEVPCARGTLVFEDRDLSGARPEARRAAGLLCAPEERLGHAAAPDMNLTENAMLTGAARRRLVRRGWLNWGAARRFANDVIAQFDVRTQSVHTPASALSGGNLQKFVIGREIMQNPRVLIVNQPTWGVDAAAAGAIRQALMDLTARGAAVVILSQDLDELMEVCDRFAALNAGHLSPAYEVASLHDEQIGILMSGAQMPDAQMPDAGVANV